MLVHCYPHGPVTINAFSSLSDKGNIMVMTKRMSFFCYPFGFWFFFFFSSENCKVTVRDVFQAGKVIKEEGTKTNPHWEIKTGES